MKTFSQRGREYALRIVRTYAKLETTTLAQCLGKQLLRSGTSVGAHLSEGKRSRSRAEIISKTEGALQELEESIYWMTLLVDTKLAPEGVNLALKEADELTAILVSGVRRLKNLKITR
jgi:four helix bundle protein